MDKVNLEVELDALKNQKPDTSAVDTLKAELEALKTKHAEELEAIQAASHKSTSNLDALTKDHEAKTAELETLKEQLSEAREDAAIAKKELEAINNDVDAKMKSHEADYKDMHDTLSHLVEEQRQKVEAAEKQAADLKEKHDTLSNLVEQHRQKVEVAEKEAANVKSRFAEMEAQLKVKDAEIAEAKAQATFATKPKSGLAASRFAGAEDSTDAESELPASEDITV
ncbi:uncharacterized protein BCR38DRAFT_243245 [Pseudomassariella vexata]|uniref:Uncharacterized protein n=1 Tax=Pseudomassariella vexata TaxID=1141098 RepID=A0A1Y2DTH7_9PEZI|nr:uncharacterized protein BCR38DRAFT_243245 [Pseudomassariella vexata]ORY62581.1 hypothetical protein BCR38DRAFT_243245 [Pseudomassariella vexata]